jgi:hypothetical protein
MLDVLGYMPAFDSLVAAVCAWRRIATNLMEDAIPATYRPGLFTAAVVRRPSGGQTCAAASHSGTTSHPHRPGAVLARTVVWAGAVRPENDHIADATVTSTVVRRPPEQPARRRRFAPEGDLALLPAWRRAHVDRRPGRGSAP